MKRSVRLCVIGLLIAPLAVALTGEGIAEPPAPGTLVQLVSQHHGKCLTTRDSSTANGAHVVQRPCAPTTSQQWRVVASGSAYQLVNVASGRCLDVPGGSNQPGTGLIQWTCGTGANQLFSLAEQPGGALLIKPQNTTPSLCLDVPGGTLADSAQLVQAACGSVSHQRWTARPATQSLANSGFESGATGWQFTAGSGTATNNPHSGTRLAYLDAGTGYQVRQTVTIGAAGNHQVSAWVATSGSTGRLSVRRGGSEIAGLKLPKETKYQRYVLGGLPLAAGETVEVAVQSATDGWVNVDDLAVQADHAELRIASSNAKLVDLFAWSAANARTWVLADGQSGPVNSGTGTYKASYWAGYAHRPAYYSRDTAHQIAGAHLLGLDQESKNMLASFAASSTAARKHYPLWAIAFDTKTPYSVDYKSDTNFVREVPAVFELVEASDRAYRWTGDPDYVTSSTLWTYYLNALNAFVDAHNSRIPNGSVKVAEGVGSSIWQGTASYNEQGGEALIEAGDAIGSQYQAYLSLANLASGRGDAATAATYRSRASDLRSYFNATWSVQGSDVVRGYNIVNGAPNKMTGWGKENSLFMPMKRILDPGPRLDSYLDFVDAKDTDPATRSQNIEAYTYLPDTYFPYNRNATAWKWMQYVYDNRSQYPELSFTLVGQTVGGLLGVEPDARAGAVVTQSHLPADVGWLRADNVAVGANRIAVRHDGATKSTLTNAAGAPALTWEARFAGSSSSLLVNGAPQPATVTTVNGVTVSSVKVSVAPGATAVVSR